jgi:CRISPR-associated endonuclease/helicase Cas3
VTLWYQSRAHLSGELQRKQPFRYDPISRQRYYLDLDEDNELVFQRFEKQGPNTDHTGRLVLESIDCAERIGFFATPDYADSLEHLAERMGLDTQGCARKFGVIDLPENRDQEQEWLYHPALGFAKHE